MEKKLWIMGIILALAIISLATFHYLNESPKIIKVGYLPSDHHAALIVADQKGMFEKEGLNVQMVPFHSGVEIAEALSKGKIDMGYSGITPITAAISKGADLKIVAPVNLDGSGIVTQKDENSAESLINETIAIPSKGSMQDILLYLYLKKNNISSQEVKYIPYEVPMMPLSLKEGTFNAYIAWEPFVSMSNMYGYGNVLVQSEDIWKDHPCCVVVTSDQFIEKKPEILRKFLKVHTEATNYIQTHPEANILLMSEKMEDSTTVEKESISHIKYVSHPDSKFIKNVIEIIKIQKEMGYIKNNISYYQIFDFNYLPSN